MFSIKYSYLLFYTTIIFVLINNLYAKGMWGARRRRDDDDDVPTGFQESQRRASILQENSGIATIPKTKRTGASENMAFDSSTISTLMETYLNMMEQLVDSPNFDEMVNIDSISSMFSQIPAFSQYPEMKQMLESPQFQDPTLLKQTIIEGIKVMREYSSSIIEMLNDPLKMEQLVEQLPAELRSVFSSILSGDKTSLKSMILNLPGVDSTQKQLLGNLIDGDSSSLMNNVQQILNNPDQVEAARKQFLEDPSMAEMLGIPSEILHSKKKWAEFMAESTNALNSMGGGAGTEEVELDSMFGSSLSS